MFPEVRKLKTMYNMIPYRSKVIHAEYHILNFSPIRHKINAYPSKLNKRGDFSSIVLLDDEHLGDTIIAGNTDIIDNRIL